MKKYKLALLLTALTSLALVGFAVYLQMTKNMLPCPLCVIQRYAFILLAIGCFIGLGNFPLARKLGCCVGLYASITGVGVALHQLYVIAHPSIRCGVDQVQVAVNSIPLADWFPTLFLAEGMCGTYYDPILGLSVPQWSLSWFTLFTALLLVILFKVKSTTPSTAATT